MYRHFYDGECRFYCSIYNIIAVVVKIYDIFITAVINYYIITIVHYYSVYERYMCTLDGKFNNLLATFLLFFFKI